MSMSYWIINGVGLNANEIIPYLNPEKTARFLIEQLPNEPEIVFALTQMLSSGNFSTFDIDDFLYGGPFDNFADLLTHCDDTDSITYGDDGDGGHYFYYPPSMPWEMRDTEPSSVYDVHDRIATAIQRIADIDRDQIDHMIDDDLYIVGCG